MAEFTASHDSNRIEIPEAGRLQMFTPPPATDLIIYTPRGELRLHLDDRGMSVVDENNVMDDAAKIFFEATLKPMVDDYFRSKRING
jgi:hypothetical protein